jgi:uncharacterized protein GlcG (DUF336 family)
MESVTSSVNSISLAAAQTIVSVALAYAREHDFKPLGIAVLDVRGALKAYAAEDGSTLGRAQIAMGKANGALAMGSGSRTLAKRGREAPQFVLAVGNHLPLGLVPGPGGVLIRDLDGAIVGAVGVSGDLSDNDELAAMAGIAAAGLTSDPGED